MIHDIPDSYPETVYEDYQIDIYAGEVKPGDRFPTDTHDRVVAKNKVGTKWSDIRDEEGFLIARLTNDTPVTVTRSRETKASRKATQRHDSNRKILRELERMKGATNPALDRAAKVLGSEYGYFDYSDVGTMLDGQATWRINNEFVHAWEYTLTSDPEKFDGDYVDFVQEFVKDLTERLLTKTRYAANRSTNQISNLMDDLQVQAMSTFIDNTKWWTA